MPIYAAGPRPATMTLAPTSRRCIKHTLDRYLPLRSSTTKQRNSADPTPQIIARIASRPVSPDSSRAQISIAPARHRPTFPDRGFLPWRLSDAGRRCTWHRRVRPASETLHISKLMRCNNVGAVSRLREGRHSAHRATPWPPSDRACRSLREPAVDRSEKLAGLLPLALIAPEPRHAHRRAQFPGFGLLMTGDLEAWEADSGTA